MPRQPDIRAAFIAAIQQNPKGYLCLHTDKFIAELQERHWHFSRGCKFMDRAIPAGLRR